MIEIRDEAPSDIEAIRAITKAAFAGKPYSDQTEAEIIDGLREADAIRISLVAVSDGEVIGNAAGSELTDITLADPTETTINGVLAVPEGWVTQSSSMAVGPMFDQIVVEPGSFTFVAPNIEDLPVYLGLNLVGPNGENGQLAVLAPKKPPWAISFPNPPEMLVPEIY